MSPFYTLCTSPMTTGSSKPLLYFCFIPLFFFAHVSSSAIPSGNTSQYALVDVFHTTDSCYQDSVVKVKQADSSKISFFSTFTTTKECSARMHENDFPEKLPSCPPGLIDLEVTPDYVPKSQLSWPYANLHMSVTAHAPIDAVFLRLQCLSTSDGADVYCSDSKDMYINGVKEWPCRGIEFSNKVKFPAKFTYACFRLTPYSVYAINATVLPQKCRASTIITSPGFDVMFPEILVDPTAKNAPKDPLWAPTLALDFSEDNAIWVRYGTAPKAECDTIKVNVYKEHENDTTKISYLETLTVKCPEKAVKWENQAAGQYLLTAYASTRGCEFMCNSTSRGCTQCLRTHLNIRLHETRASIPWLAVQKFKDHSYEILITVLVLFGIFIIASLVGFAVYCYKKKKESEIVRDIQLRDFIKPMIVYADDSHLHTKCVTHLVEYLRKYANCDSIFDVEKLITLENVTPSRWLYDQLSSANKFIIVMSHCAELVLDTVASETHELANSRPFGDLFRPAIDAILSDVAANPSVTRKKYCIVRFSYAPPVPPNLALLGFPVFNLPTDFPHLTAFLHSLEYGERLNITQNIPPADMNTWRSAADEKAQFIINNPGWLKDRWKPKSDQQMMELKRKSPVVIQTEQDRIKASKKYNLLPPKQDIEDEEEEEQPTTSTVVVTESTFLIQPPKPRTEEEAESSSEDDEDEEDQGSDTIVAYN
ncbi:hypothetical protein CAEBREN_30906 [Caenorhabditis brenneri]|uniref:SEFIR domain-containing protein n=1 Tax=Caenorhabditis brenneri TaxID=135651 RepID=G0PHG3_CAEBE|nr:hypothetical protein CAEBREN_30906 [Caenorhabditis brenneri]